uniref:oxaloacetate tautomerase n=1 Tax=Panagrellus redivivus TaxID=6233 RepID=A0A7E4VCS4_PANRE
MDVEEVKNNCGNIIGFENSFPCPDGSQAPLAAFKRDAKFLETEGHHITIPAGHLGVDTEVHLGVVISEEASEISPDAALSKIGGYVVALNSRLRLREFTKASETDIFNTTDEFKGGVVISPLVSKDTLEHPNVATIWAAINNQEVQRSNFTSAKYTVQELLSKASQLTTLKKGDIILTGSPSGATYVRAGDTVEIGIEGLIRSEFSLQKAIEVDVVPSDRQDSIY